MKRETLHQPIYLPMILAVTCLCACGSSDKGTAPPGGPLAGKITMDGSATVYPLFQAVAAGFKQTHPNVQAEVAFSGTGGGFKKFCMGAVDLAGASRPIKTEEGALCRAQHVNFIEIPIAFDSLAVLVNPKNTFVDCLTVAELKAVWQPAAEGKITQWKQIRPSFPAQPLELLGPGRASGTFDYFTYAIIGTEASSRNDYAASEDDMVIERGVAGDPNALGYFGYAYYQANQAELKVVAVDNGKGCIVPSPQTVADGSYQPLTRPLFVYVNATAAARPEVRAFIQFELAPQSTKYVTQVGYVPLSTKTLTAQLDRFEKGATGSALGGHGSVTGVKLDAFEEWEKERERVANELVQ